MTTKKKVSNIQRVVGPFSGVKLIKPGIVTLHMLEAWDVCYDGYVWLKNNGSLLPLTPEAIEKAMQRTHVGEFQISWLITINNHVFENFLRQTDSKPARIAINKMRAEYNASVTSTVLALAPSNRVPDQIVRDRKLLLALKLLENIRNI